LHRPAVSFRYNVTAVVDPDTEPQKFLSLRYMPALQFFDGHRGQGDGSDLAALGFLLSDFAGVGLFGAGDDGQLVATGRCASLA